MQRWTDGRFHAPVHRVVNPQPRPDATAAAAAARDDSAGERRVAAMLARRPGPSRQCAAFFMHANYDALVTPPGSDSEVREHSMAEA